ETWQVPPEAAAFLGRPHVTNSTGLALESDRIQVRRETDDGEETVEVPRPAVVSVARSDREPQVAAPGDGRIDVWAATDLVDEVREYDKRFGQTGSPTRVLAVRDVTPERAGERIESVETAASRVRELAEERPAGETAWEKPGHLGEEPGASYDCWTFVETVGGRATRAALGPRVAGELALGMTADCVDLGIDRAGRLIQHKPAYGGNIVSVIMGATTPQLATVRPRMFEPLQPRDAGADVRRIELQALPEGTTRILERAEADPPPRRLDEADIVVAVGAGVDPAAIQEATQRAGAEIGGDRAACAAGRVPWGAEIGLQGRSVAPRVYLAIETTPGFEHLTGSVKAGVIAAIASDAGSPLLAAADVALVGDWRELAPALLT